MAINWKNVGEAADVWMPMAQYKVKDQSARQAAGAKRAQDVWNAQVGVLDTIFKENASQYAALNKGVAEGTFDLADPTMLDAYTDAFNLSIQSQRDLIEHSGMKVRQPIIRDLTTFFSGVMDNFLQKNPKGDFDVMKWGNKDGLWGDVIHRLDKSINREDAHRVWESLWNERAGKRKDVAGGERGFFESPFAGGQGLIGSIATQGAGLLPDLLATGANLFLSEEDRIDPANVLWGGREKLSQLPKGRTIGDITGQFKDKLSGKPARDVPSVWPSSVAGTDKPVITPTDKSVAMGPFAGLDNGLISGFLARGEDAVAAKVTEIGEDVDELKDVEQRAQEREVEKGLKIRDIAQEAATFIANYLQMILDHGEDEAKSMMSRDFSNLSTSAKKDVQIYLMSQ